MTIHQFDIKAEQTGGAPFLLDGVFIALKFGLPVSRMRELMSRGMVKSRVEKGSGENAGQWRITLRLGNRIWRGVFSADGQLRHEMTGIASQAGSKGQDEGKAPSSPYSLKNSS